MARRRAPAWERWLIILCLATVILCFGLIGLRAATIL